MTITKPQKLPSLSPNTKLLSFDLETNGLHGNAFAVGAVVMSADGNIVDQFTGRCEITEAVDSWVEANVLPLLGDMPVEYADYQALREGFWEWYLQAEPQSDYVLVSNGYPVEYRFLLQCQEEDIEGRYWQHPFPILDLTSILIASGNEPSDKNQLMNEIVRKGKFSRHHPLHDAKIATLTAFQAFRKANLL